MGIGPYKIVSYTERLLPGEKLSAKLTDEGARLWVIAPHPSRLRRATFALGEKAYGKDPS